MSKHINIQWQEGTVKDVGVNGVQIEDVLQVAKERLEALNKEFPCRENAMTITKLDEAIMWQNKRTTDRLKRGVEGTHKA